MKVITEGHIYEIENVNVDTKGKADPGTQRITFVKRFRDEENHPGTVIQELLRVCIDRLIFLDKELPWPLNSVILKCLRKALALFEARAIIRKVEKEELLPERLATGKDGHILLTEQKKD